MAYNGTPTNWLSGITNNGTTTFTNTLANFPELTISELNTDIRKVYFAWCEAMYQSYNSKAVTDRPTKMTLQKGSSVDSITGVVTNYYTLTFQTAVLTQDVVSE